MRGAGAKKKKKVEEMKKIGDKYQKLKILVNAQKDDVKYLIKKE